MKKLCLILIGLVLLLGAAGCSKSKSMESGTSSSHGESTTPAPSQQTNVSKQATVDLQKTTFKVSPREALDIAATKGSGDASKLELEQENNVYAYKVEMMTDTHKTKVGIDANNKSILENKTDVLDTNKVKTDRQQSKIDLTAIIDEMQAMKIATEKVNGTATKWKIERKNGPTYYEVDVHSNNREYEIKIDAKSGKILNLGQDD